MQCMKGEEINWMPGVWFRVLGRLGLPPHSSHPCLLPRAILEAPVTEPRFLEQLQELDAKAAAVREQEARGTAACADVRGVLDRLRVKVGSGGGHPRNDSNQPPLDLYPGLPWQSSR